ncbi:hypothetical protein HHK36_018887 [Tetracentron sinense]|uniref:Uncharacterized protein n=1 Tax=Tetracentron sinense TaxID=13715 RepID=A0A835D926_TETSI|nr:hypothetical protein HHK36_018887 [Tetracentron sinense]
MGTLTAFLFLISSIFFNWWFVFFVPFFGYGFAWYSHFFVEGNFPATFGHPFWSLVCDFKMFGLMLTGKMDKEIKRLGKRPVLQAPDNITPFHTDEFDIYLNSAIKLFHRGTFNFKSTSSLEFRQGEYNIFRALETN